MFGILYTLFGIGAAVKDLAQYGAESADSMRSAIEVGKAVYTDARGRYRLVDTNELIRYKEDNFTKDWGYEIIDPRSKNRGTFVNLSESERQNEWMKAHSNYLAGKPYFNEYDREMDAIPWFRLRSGNQDDQNYVLMDKETGRLYHNPGRACQGLRYKDIATGKMMVVREFQITDDDFFKTCGNRGRMDFYIDVETGEIIRPRTGRSTDNEANVHIDDFIARYNAKQKEKLEAGVRETDPKDFFQNDYRFSNRRHFDKRWL